MKYNASILRDYLNKYFAGEVTKEEMGEWARNAYYEFLMGGAISIEKIAVYPFVKVLSALNVVENDVADVFPCSSEEVERIHNVLSGMQEEIFNINFRIPWNINWQCNQLNYEKREQYCILKQILLKYQNENELSKEDKSKCLQLCACKEEKGTIMALLASYIKACVSRIVEVEEIDYLSSNLGLFGSAAPTQEHIVVKLLNRIDEYIGEKDLNISILYVNGEYRLFLG